ncbi:MAG: hypothetical protein M1377_07920, partial [Deltaproteobacteria bacterium]|nr:hypothetical protein [Deltaproteobacteria bacterium]
RRKSLSDRWMLAEDWEANADHVRWMEPGPLLRILRPRHSAIPGHRSQVGCERGAPLRRSVKSAGYRAEGVGFERARRMETIA